MQNCSIRTEREGGVFQRCICVEAKSSEKWGSGFPNSICLVLGRLAVQGSRALGPEGPETWWTKSGPGPTTH